MSTAALVSAFGDSEIIGADLSEEMLAKARKNISQAIFIRRDFSQPLSDLGKFDLIFSNAFIQWLPDQKEFMEDSFRMLSEGGVFAAQIPLFGEMPANNCIVKAEELFADKIKGIEKSRFVLHTASEYYDMITSFTDKTTVWITEYVHKMKDYGELLNFLKGAALRPHLELLTGRTDREQFLNTVLENIRGVYPVEKNGKVLFPFRRLFLIGEKCFFTIKALSTLQYFLRFPRRYLCQSGGCSDRRGTFPVYSRRGGSVLTDPLYIPDISGRSPL